MNRIPILAGGAVLAAVVLCGGAVTMANAFSTGEPAERSIRPIPRGAIRPVSRRFVEPAPR